MPNNIHILSDLYSSEELFELFSEASSDIEFALIPNDQKLRSPFADPTILAALIGAGATTLASLIGVLGVVWATLRKDKKEKDEWIIEIKIKPSGIEKINQLDEVKQQVVSALFAGNDLKSESLRLEDPNLVLQGETYEEVIGALLMEDVEHVILLGDE